MKNFSIYFISALFLSSLAFLPFVLDNFAKAENGSTISVSTDKKNYKDGDMVRINGAGASSYSITIKIISPSGVEVSEVSTFKTSAGDFSTIWIIPRGLDDGTYTISASDASQTDQATITIGAPSPPKIPMPGPATTTSTKIPDWLKQVGEFWITERIDDSGFVQIIEYLVQQEIISLPYAESPDEQAEAGTTANIPPWIKTNTEFWVTGKISDDEFSIGLEWLINNGIIRV